jgi:N-formylmaleamate deformylase
MKKLILILLSISVCCSQPQDLRAADAVPFSVVVTGSGAPMILIPGLSCGGNVWDGTVAHFKDHYQCHVLTLAGFAGQPPMDGPFLDKVCDGIISYIKDKKLDHPVIIGHSLGGMMSFWLAEKAPDAVGPVISVDGLPYLTALMNPGGTPDATAAMAEKYRARYAALSAQQFIDNDHKFLATGITDPANVDKVASLGDKSDPKAVGQAFFDLITTDLRPDLKSIKAPVLLIGAAPGEAFKEKKRDSYAAQIADVPHHKLVFATTGHHFVQLDDPEFFYHEVEAFLKENQK